MTWWDAGLERHVASFPHQSRLRKAFNMTCPTEGKAWVQLKGVPQVDDLVADGWYVGDLATKEPLSLKLDGPNDRAVGHWLHRGDL